MKQEQHIGNNIQKFRNSMGLSQGNIADYLGITQHYVSMLESGERNLTASIINALADLFCCDKQELLAGERSDKVCKLAFRSKDLQPEDLIAIAAVNKIVKNQMKLERLAKEEQ